MFRGERGSRGAEVTEAKPEIAKMPFEAALAELEAIVDQLEKGAVALDESISLYERGEALKRRCDELLKNAEIISAMLADGGVRLHPDSVMLIAHEQVARTRHVRIAIWIAAGALGVLALLPFI